jgi:hypothetical protein
MKGTLTALAIAALASTAFAAIAVACRADLERIPPTLEQVLTHR